MLRVWRFGAAKREPGGLGAQEMFDTAATGQYTNWL